MPCTLAVMYRDGQVTNRQIHEDCDFQIDPRAGYLNIVKGNDVIMVYAAGNWLRVLDVGAFEAAKPTQVDSSENPRRRQEARAIPKA